MAERIIDDIEFCDLYAAYEDRFNNEFSILI